MESPPAEFATRVPPELSPEQILHHDGSLFVVRCRRATGGTVLVKGPAGPYNRWELARYRREYAVVRDLAVPGVARARALREVAGRPVMVLDDPGGGALAAKAAAGPWPWRRTADLLLALARALEGVHRKPLVHGAVHPRSVLLTAAGAPLLTHFVACLPAPSELRDEGLEGCDLAFLPPERTGRVNRATDWRADLYGLGVLAWQLLFGELPFAGAGPVERLHAVLAVAPRAPRRRRPDVPPALSQMVLRLLAKDPEDRYQSAGGLAADLERCLQGREQRFDLGRNDRPPSFAVPDRVFGRQAERRALQHCLVEAGHGSMVSVLLRGAAGIGKTRLALELQRAAAAAGGQFALGRFEPFEPGLALAVVREALAGPVARQTARGGGAAALRREVQRRVGANDALLARLVPGIAALQTETGAVPMLDDATVQARAGRAIAALIGALGAVERPLVLVLDDLQWADRASLELLADLWRRQSCPGLLLVGCWRDGDDRASPHLERLIDALRPEHRPQVMRLGPLDRAAATQLVCSTCHSGPIEGRRLADQLLAHTRGNPLSLRAALERLHEEGRLRPESGGYCWDAGGGDDLDPPDDEDAPFLDLDGLPESCLEALGVAACVGRSFELGLTSESLGTDVPGLCRLLKPAVARGLVVPGGAAYYLAAFQAPAEGARGEEATARFAHARVHEAAHRSLPAANLARTHRRLGGLMLRRAAVPEQDERLPVLVDHLLQALPLLERDERTRFARLALAAGLRAREVTAFDAALRYFEGGVAALGDEGWARDYEVTRDLHRGAIGCAVVVGAWEVLQPRVDALMAHARVVADEVDAWVALVRAAAARGDGAAAVDIVDRFWRRTGRRPPRPGGGLRLLRTFAETRLAMGWKRPEDLLRLPPAHDPVAVALQSVGAYGSVAQMLSSAESMAFATLRDARLLLQDGLSPYGIRSLIGYGAMEFMLTGQMRRGVRFGEQALSHIERMGWSEMWPQAAAVVYFVLKVWTEPPAALVEPQERICQRALELGDADTATVARIGAFLNRYVAGQALEQLEEVASDRDLVVAFVEEASRAWVHWSIRWLRGAAADADEPRLGAAHIQGVAHFRSFFQLHHALLRGDLEVALRLGLAPNETLDNLPPTSSDFSFWAYLVVSVQRCRECGLPVPRRAWRRLAKGTRVLRRLARFNPARAHLAAWVEAAGQAAKGQVDRALRGYERALDLARRQEVWQDVGLMAEHAGELATRAGRPFLARSLRREALHAWERWGAPALVQRLLERHPDPRPRAEGTVLPNRSGIDARALIRASQALSEERVYDRLLSSIMTTLVETAGAVRGALILGGPAGATVEAEVQADPGADPGGRPVCARTPLDDAEELPRGLISQVLRTGAATNLHNASLESPHRDDPYIRAGRIRSVLCLPVERGGEILGAVYLENGMLSGAFGPDEFEALRILARQAAVSLESARLVEELERTVRTRTRDQEEALARAEQASRAKSDFLAHVTHELRTPLNAILGHAHVLAEQPAVTDAAQAVLRNGRHLLSLVDDNLDLAAIEAGCVEIAEQRVDLRYLAADLRHLLQPRADRKDLRLDVAVEPSVPRAVATDGKRLRQVLLNLLGNGLKFTDQGAVSLRISLADGAGEARATLRFEVRDTGPGIEPSRRQAVFEPYERGDATKPGTGLGLAISQRLVALMGGRLCLDGDREAGSVFWFELPVAVVEWRGDEPPETQTARPSRDEALAAPPPEQVRALLDLAVRGDLTTLVAQARTLAEDARHAPLARRLEALAEDFDDTAIQRLLQTLL